MLSVFAGSKQTGKTLKMKIHTKQLFFIPFLISFTLLCNGQAKEVKIDSDYFLLGTLSDYMGREKYKETVNRVDEYYENDKLLVLFLDSLFSDKYPDLKLITSNKSGRLELESKTLAQKMTDFYLFYPSGRSSYVGETDFETLNFDSLSKTDDFYTTYFDTIYTGCIKSDIFKNDSERLSFITGAYIRFGGKNDSVYFISIANSVSKVKVATEQLKELKCSNINYFVKEGNIPTPHTVYFTPTNELMKYFNAINQKLAFFSEPKSTK